MIYLERGLAIGSLGVPGGFDFAWRSRVTMEVGRFRTSRLRCDHALGNSGRGTDVAGLSNHTLEFFRECSGNETSPMNRSLTQSENRI